MGHLIVVLMLSRKTPLRSVSVAPHPPTEVGDLSPQERGEAVVARALLKRCGACRLRVSRPQHLAPLLRGEVADFSRRVRGDDTRISREHVDST
jgi:hypothetical protein